MFYLLLDLSRYIFLIYLLFFIWQSIIYIYYERGKSIGNPHAAIARQRAVVVCMHITAFLILSYNAGKFSFNLYTLFIGVLGLIFLILSSYFVKILYDKGCPLIWNCMFFLIDVGLIMLERLNPDLAVKQLLWISTGIIVTLLIPIVLKFIPRFESFENLYIIFAFILMLSTFLLGKEQFGSKNWIKIGSFGMQPSEIVKFLFIFYLACVFRKRIELKQLIKTGIISGTLVLMLVIQKDLGGALIFFMTYMVMLYISTSNSVLFLGGMGVAAFGAGIAYKLFSHVRVRVSAWQNPWGDIDSGGYQIVQSLFALCTWGFFGSGLTKGMPKSIPVVEKDFIFAAVCEEFGVIFGIGIICIFVIIFFRGILIALRCERRFYSLLAAGVVSMLSFQTFLIIGGVIKFIPLTGVTLPFISYGGSSVIISIIMIGFLQWTNAYYEKHSLLGGESSE